MKKQEIEKGDKVLVVACLGKGHRGTHVDGCDRCALVGRTFTIFSSLSGYCHIWVDDYDRPFLVESRQLRLLEKWTGKT